MFSSNGFSTPLITIPMTPRTEIWCGCEKHVKNLDQFPLSGEVKNSNGHNSEMSKFYKTPTTMLSTDRQSCKSKGSTFVLVLIARNETISACRF